MVFDKIKQVMVGATHDGQVLNQFQYNRLDQKLSFLIPKYRYIDRQQYIESFLTIRLLHFMIKLNKERTNYIIFAGQ